MKKIAVFVPHRAQFGNITTQLPLFCALKTRFPKSEITVFTKSNNSDLFLNCSLVNKVVNYKKWSTVKLVIEFNKCHFDSVFNIYSGSERIHLICMFSNVKNKFSFSSLGFIKWFNNYQVFLDSKKGKQYIANNNLELANVALGTDYDTRIIGMLGSEALELNKKETLTIVPCGGAGAFKIWPLEHFLSAVKKIVLDNECIQKICVVLGPQESDKQQQIERELEGLNLDIRVSPKISDLVDIAKQSRLVISNDCGPCHIFQMMKSPMLMIWGWTHCPRTPKSPYHVLTEWYHCYEDSWCVFPAEDQKDIASIPVERVVSVANMQLTRS